MAKKVKDELLAIQNASKDGILHAAAVVVWARRNRKSALHRQFEWNDSKAATEFRIWQARRLIQINIVSEAGGPSVVSLSFDRPNGGGYRSISDVLSNRKMSAIMLQDALNDLERVQARYQHVRELVGVWDEIKRVRKSKNGQPKKSAQRQIAKAA